MSRVLVESWGGVNEYGRNCFYVECGNKRILLDCGINKGTKKYPDFKKEKVELLDYVFLSHSHIDHYGALHELYNLGYKNDVYMTENTKNQIKSYLDNHKEIKPVFIEDSCGPLVWHDLDKDTSILWGRNGHVQGAIWLAIRFGTEVLFYSGDYSNDVKLIPQDDPVKALKNCVIENGIIDCGSGKVEDSYYDIIKVMEENINKVIKKNGSVLFLSHKYGKGPELLILLLKAFVNMSFAVTEDFMNGISELVNISPYINEDELDNFKKRIQIIDKAFNLDKVKETSTIYFCEDACIENEIEYKLLRKINMRKENMIIFTNRQAKGSIGSYMLSNKEKFECDIKYINIKAHQSKIEAVSMARKMHIKNCIYFHDDRKLSLV